MPPYLRTFVAQLRSIGSRRSFSSAANADSIDMFGFTSRWNSSVKYGLSIYGCLQIYNAWKGYPTMVYPALDSLFNGEQQREMISEEEA